jgi:hypothetical protein
MSSNSISEIGRTHDRMPAFSLAIDEAGRLSIAPEGHPVNFRCRCLGFTFEGHLLPDEGSPTLELAAVLRALPFSIEQPNLRQQILQLLRASEILPHARMVQLSDGRIGATGRLPLGHPATQPRLIGAATVLILELLPYLALAAELLAPPNRRAAFAA